MDINFERWSVNVFRWLQCRSIEELHLMELRSVGCIYYVPKLSSLNNICIYLQRKKIIYVYISHRIVIEIILINVEELVRLY